MDKIGCGKWNIWIVVLLLGTTLSAVVTTQPDENNITWVTDANYIDIGQTGKTGDAIQLGSGSYSQNLRFFPKPLNKSCYQLPVTPDVPHLLRLWFAVESSSALELFPSFSYSIETLGMLYTKNITPTQRYTPDTFEGILVSSGTLLCICLIRTSETDDPFINAIELRTLRDGMYAEAKPGTMLILRRRLNCGGHSTVRSLENNHLMGPLPNFSSLTMLERLYLQNNSLNGSVPDWLSGLKNLKELFIQNNNFSGVIPPQLLLNRSLKLIRSGNPYLCVHKGDCIPPNSNKNKRRIVLGITLGGILVIAVALIVGIVVYRKKFRRKEGAVDKSSEYSMTMVLKAAKSRAFTLDEVKVATEDFSKKIGQGGFGSVFFGKLPEGKEIAVKVLSLFSKQGAQEFLNEVDLLSRVNHKNLVSLLGYCNESRELMLVYEHMSGGSLKDHLYGFSAGLTELNWKTRVKIVLDAAQGLEYLHQGCTPRIIHRDVKTANILLDSNMNGKLADFGLSRMTMDGEDSHVTTTVKGTPGYLDPEYFNTRMLTDKSDAYSFGVVLLEIICGRKPIDLSVEEVNLIRWVTSYVERAGNSPCIMAEIIDKRLEANYCMESVTRVAKVAIRCVRSEPSSRPSVSEVVAELKEAIKLLEDDASTSISGDAAMESNDLQASPIMDWGDDSSNLLKEGR